MIAGSLWKVALFVIVVSYLVLLVVLRSVVLPLKAVLMNALSVAAAYGVLVIVFQWGWFDGFLGFESLGYVQAITPALLLAVVFGLSMDYEVFMLSRIKERYQATGDTQQAVAQGLAASAKTISSAALIMVAVFAIFAGTGVPQIKEIGVGLAVAIALDATIVRLLLVPTTMALLGDLNWWLPKWLDRVCPTWTSSPPKPRNAPRGSGRPHEADVKGRHRHRLLVRYRPRDRRAAREGAAGPSTRPRAGPSRSPTSRPSAARRSRSTSTSEESMQAAVETVEEAEGGDRRARQQRRHPGDRRDRDAADGPRPRHLRDQRLRAGAARPARAAGDARAGAGRIVTIGSMNGQVHLARHRLLLRRPSTRSRRSATRCATRCRPFGIDVVLLEPGFVKTPLGKTAVGRRADDDDGPYGNYNAEVAEVATTYTTGMLGMLACSPEAVAKVVLKALDDKGRPSARYRVGALRAPVHGPAQGAAGRRRSTPSCARRYPRRLNVAE